MSDPNYMLRNRTVARRSIGRANTSLSVPSSPQQSRSVSPATLARDVDKLNVLIRPDSRENMALPPAQVEDSNSDYGEARDDNVSINTSATKTHESVSTNASINIIQEVANSLEVTLPKEQRKSQKKPNSEKAQSASRPSSPIPSTSKKNQSTVKKAKDQQSTSAENFGIPGAENLSPLNTNRFEPLDAFPEITLRGHQLTQGVHKIIGHSDFSIKKRNANCIEIYTKSVKDHSAVESLLEAKGSPYFTHTPKELRPISLIIRGIDISVPENDIQEDLCRLIPDLEILQLSRYTTPTMKRLNSDSDLVLIQVGKDTNLKKLTSQRRLCYHVVSWEHLNPIDTMQCKSCQRFGHIAKKCGLGFRCVKCNQKHAPGQCARTNPNEGLPWCINCKKAGHPANYKQCPARLAYIESKRKESEEAKKQAERAKLSSQERNFMVNNYRKSQISYADHLQPVSSSEHPSQIVAQTFKDI